MFNNIITFFLFALLSFVAGVAIAGTPDGETPATEDVCDVLKDGTPGLYGLCVAYCEAQDLDVEGNEKKSKDSLLKAYDKKRIKQGGPVMPCLLPDVPPCFPCLPTGPNPNCPPEPPDECPGFPPPGSP